MGWGASAAVSMVQHRDTLGGRGHLWFSVCRWGPCWTSPGAVLGSGASGNERRAWKALPGSPQPRDGLLCGSCAGGLVSSGAQVCRPAGCWEPYRAEAARYHEGCGVTLQLCVWGVHDSYNKVNHVYLQCGDSCMDTNCTAYARE